MHGGEGDRGDVSFPRVGSWDFGWGPPCWIGEAAADLILAANFFLDFPEARLGASVNLRSRF